MKKVKFTLMTVVMLLVLAFNAQAQDTHPTNATWPTYRMEIRNDSLLTDKIYEFDVFIKCNSLADLKLNLVQYGFLFNLGIINGGTIATPTFTSGDLPLYEGGTWGIATNATNGNIKRAFNSSPGTSGASVITFADGWKKAFRLRITNSVSFGQVKPNLSYLLTNSTGFTKTSLSAYVGTTNTSITTSAPNATIQAWHINSNLNNPTLNKPILAKTINVVNKTVTVPASENDLVYYCIKGTDTITKVGTGSDLDFTNLNAGIYKVTAHRPATYMYLDMNNTVEVVDVPLVTLFNVTGGGSYCVGSAGVSVGLDGSQATYSYQLYKDNVAEGLPLAGTGAALTWNNLTAGVYTVKATDGATTAMTGSANVTATALPATPVVSVVDNCDGTSTLTITNPEVGATFAWTGGLTGNPATANVSGNYSVTQTLGCTSLASLEAVAAPKTTPATPLASVMDNCGNSEFSISNLEAGATLTWYDGATAVHTGNNYSVTTIVTLTAKQENGGCTSNASNVVTSAPTVAVTPSVAIAASANGVCAGTSVTFTPTPINGGATPSYEWFVGAVSQGTSASFAYIPVDGDVVSCVMTSAEACVTTATANSNAIIMVVNPTVTPSVTINEANYACQGTQLTYTPVPVNGGAAPTYEWFVGATSHGTSATFTYSPSNGDNVFCFMTSNAACVTSPTATSNIVNVFVATPMAVSVSMNAVGGNTVCAGTTVNFTASGAGGGAMPIYEFFVNNVSVQSGAMMSSYSYVPANGDLVKCVFTSDMGCVSGNPATSSEITMIVNAPVEPTVSIVADANNVCAGTTVTYTATPVNGGTAAYQWKVNGNPVGAGLATYAYAPVNGDVITCVMTSDLGCVTSATATSNAVNMTINAPVTPSITIAADINNVCAGTTITFTATPVNGGNPTYLWKVNGFDAGVPSSPTFASNLFANDDVVSCIMTSDLGCVTSATATSNAANVSINAALPVSVSIVADANNVCAGTTVTYTATPVNGGIAHYNWHINGNTQGNDSPTFAYQPANGDQVYVIMTSDLACVSGNPATSNTVTTTVNPTVMTSVAISQSNNGNPICAGELVTYTATPTNGGTNPTYVWKVLSNPGISTGTTPTFTYAPAAGDLVTVEMTSDLACTSSFPAVANSMTIIYNPGGAQVVTIAASANPSVQGQPVTYMATVTPVAAGQIFDWYVNTVWQNTAGVNTFSYVPANGDVVSCAAVPTGCYTGGISNNITMTVNPTPNVTNTWIGLTTDWNTASNWTMGIPMANHDVIIPSAALNFPIIGAPAVCHDITIQSGAQLIQNSTLAIGGKVYAQQLLTPGTWHFVSSPINNATAYAFSNANPVNFGQNLFLQTYNESWINNPGTSPWVDVTNGPGEIMSAGKGYEAWSDNNHIITMEGTQLNSAAIVAPVTYTVGASYPGYNLIGNSYPSAINILGFQTWGSNMDASMWLWNGANYISSNGVIGDFTTVASNQAFMVKANAVGAMFTIPSTAKTFGGSFLKSTVADVLKLKVSGNGYNDAAFINFNSNATANYDGQFDVEKIFGIDAAPQFYSTITNKNLSINTLPSLTSPVVVPMSLNVGANATYTITASEMSSFANGTTITLEDTKTGTFTNLMQQAVYTFTASPADNANRFKVHFGVNGINENTNGNISIYSNSNVIYVNNNSNEVVKEIVVMNVLGQEILNKKAANTTVNTITMDVASAYYVVKVVTENKVYTEKVYVR